jgi:hypothetical protein
MGASSRTNDDAPTGHGRGVGTSQSLASELHANDTSRFHVTHATAEPLLARLDGVQKSGAGWRARCPACDGRSRKVSIAVHGERVLVHCFAGCRADDVLAAVGLRWGDLQPPRNLPLSPDERRRSLRAAREFAWSAALSTLAQEACVVHIAGLQVASGATMQLEDLDRLALACLRIEKAALTLVERDSWKPEDCYPPVTLLRMRIAAVEELKRQLIVAENNLRAAEDVILGKAAA